MSGCQSCGACCFSRSDEYVPVTDTDRRRLGAAAADLCVERRGRLYMKMSEGHCAALEISAAGFRCSIYESRPAGCRELDEGSPACEAERREKRSLVARVRPVRS